MVLSVFAAFAYVLTLTFLFPGIARYRVRLGQAFKNCLPFALRRPGATLLMLVLHGLTVLLCAFLNLAALPICAMLRLWNAALLLGVFESFN